MDNKLKQLIEAERMKYTGAVPQNFSKHLARLRKASNLSQKLLRSEERRVGKECL